MYVYACKIPVLFYTILHNSYGYLPILDTIHSTVKLVFIVDCNSGLVATTTKPGLLQTLKTTITVRACTHKHVILFLDKRKEQCNEVQSVHTVT